MLREVFSTKYLLVIGDGMADDPVPQLGNKTPLQAASIPAIDARTLGQLYYYFIFSCYLSCELLGVNPFDQPGVEAYKHQMFQLLGKY